MLKIYNCLRCGYEWASRINHRPVQCSKCKAPYWWRLPRVKGIAEQEANEGLRRKYPVGLLQVNEEMSFDLAGLNLVSFKQAVCAFGRRYGRSYGFTVGVSTVRVKRVK